MRDSNKRNDFETKFGQRNKSFFFPSSFRYYFLISQPILSPEGLVKSSLAVWILLEHKIKNILKIGVTVVEEIFS